MSTHANFNDAEKKKELTRRVLWKLDCNILPPLALVRELPLRLMSAPAEQGRKALARQLHRQK
jgi:hypothetical protein